MDIQDGLQHECVPTLSVMHIVVTAPYNGQWDIFYATTL